MFLQGDLKAAAAAFQKVTEADPNNPDGWVNIGRALCRKAIWIAPAPCSRKRWPCLQIWRGRNFFYARVLRADGNYEGAAARLRTVLAQYPRDRVALNDLGRILFLQRKYAEAVNVLQSVFCDRSRRPSGAL